MAAFNGVLRKFVHDFDKGKMVADASDVHSMFEIGSKLFIANRIQCAGHSLTNLRHDVSDFGIGLSSSFPLRLSVIPLLKWRLSKLENLGRIQVDKLLSSLLIQAKLFENRFGFGKDFWIDLITFRCSEGFVLLRRAFSRFRLRLRLTFLWFIEKRWFDVVLRFS